MNLIMSQYWTTLTILPEISSPRVPFTADPSVVLRAFLPWEEGCPCIDEGKSKRFELRKKKTRQKYNMKNLLFEEQFVRILSETSLLGPGLYACLSFFQKLAGLGS